MKLFISYSFKDAFAARMIAGWLEDAGHQITLAQKSFSPGSFPRQITAELEASAGVIAILTDYLKKSKWCREELRQAKQLEKFVVFAGVQRNVKPPEPYENDLPVELCPDLQTGSRKVWRDIRGGLLGWIEKCGMPFQASTQIDLNRWFSTKLPNNSHVRAAVEAENLRFNTLHVATTVELAHCLDGWNDEHDIRTVLVQEPVLTTEEVALASSLPPRDPRSDRLNAALRSYRAPLSDENALEMKIAPIRHQLVRTIADRFGGIRARHPDLPMLSEEQVNFANSVIVHLLVITSDGYVLLGQRSARPRFYENCWAATCEEHIDFEHDAGCPFRTARRGLKEELVGDDPKAGESPIRFFSLFREPDHWSGPQGNFWDINIGIAGQVRLALTSEEVFANWRAVAVDKREFRHLVAVPYDPEMLSRILFTNYLEPAIFGDDAKVPEGTDRTFLDVRGNRDWQRQHPTNKIRIIRSLTHDFRSWCFEQARASPV